MSTLQWHTDFPAAITEVERSRKPVLLQFIRENCAGCSKMDHHVFSDASTVTMLGEQFVPLRQNILTDRAVRSRYAALWTPSFYFLNTDGKLLWFSEGPLDTADFRTVCALGRSRYLLHKGRYEEVIDLVDARLAARENDPRGPQLIFTRGMAYYLRFGDKDAFHAAMEEIVERYPHSPEARMWPWEGQYPLPPGYENP